MSHHERIKVKMRNFFSNGIPKRNTGHDIEANKKPQYRLKASNRYRNGRSWRFCCRGAAGVTELSDIKPNERIASSLHWMFRSNFLVLFTVMCLCFFALIIIFAGIIIGAGQLDRECVRVGTKGEKNRFSIQHFVKRGTMVSSTSSHSHPHLRPFDRIVNSA